MNFFEQQDRARQNTSMLVGLFGLSVATMTGFIYAVAIAAANLSQHPARLQCPQPSVSAPGPYSDPDLDRIYRRQSGSLSAPTSQSATCDTKTVFIWWNPQILLWVTLLTASVVGGASLYKISELKQGGATVALDLGGRLLVPEMADEPERQLLNVVEEMAIAAGIPVPYVFVLQNEDEINAFAAGYSPETAVLGVTRGALTQLNRDELQGVIGHEFSHILNGDMRLNIRLMGLLHGILFVYLAGRALLHSRDNRSNAGWVLGLALMAIGSTGVLCGRLIQSAVSRQREFLADASAVQFTRNLEGIASALEKLASVGSRLVSPQAEAARHIFFGNAMGRAWAGDWFATHPPLPDRIARLRGRRSKFKSRTGQTPQSVAGTMGFAGSSDPTFPESVVGQVGTVSPEHYTYTQGLLAQIPEDLRRQIRDTQGAIATIYALFLDPTDELAYEHQIQSLSHAETESTLVEAIQIGKDVQSLDPRLRLPLIDLAVPSLRACPLERLETLCKGLQDLAQADGAWTFSEFALFLVLQRRLEMQGATSQVRSDHTIALEELWDESLTLLSALASCGDTNPNAITYAFRCGVFKLPAAVHETVPEQAIDWTLDTVRQSLERLRKAEPKAKQTVVNACAHTVLLDQEVTIQEAELLRAIAIVLDCPIPPFLNALRSSKASA